MREYKRAYLCGPIAGCTDEEAKGWRQKVANLLHFHGWVAVDPMRNDYRGRNTTELNEEIVELDLEDIEFCDVLIANPWKSSTGTSMEIAIAHRMGKRVIIIGAKEKLSPWIVYHSDEITEFLGEAVSLAVGVQHV